MNRRDFTTLLITGAAALAGAAGRGRAQPPAPRLSDDGLYEEPFFIQSFLDLKEDLETASAAGRRFAIIWELRGCPYCRDTHLINFADPRIRTLIESDFDILQLNVLGARKVTDFDGEELPEKALARKWRVVSTPTMQFFPDDPALAAGRPGHAIEVARMPGYFRPPHFLAMLRFVVDKEYLKTDFMTYLKSLPAG